MISYSGAHRIGVVLALLAWPLLGAQTRCLGADGPNRQSLEAASQIVEDCGLRGGVAVVMGRPKSDLAHAISKQGSFVVQALFDDRSACDAQRRAIRAADVYGVVSAGVWKQGRLPYTDNLINILIIDGYSEVRERGVDLAEIARSMAPLGTVFLGGAASQATLSSRIEALRPTALATLGSEPRATKILGRPWIAITKGWPTEIDQWTHFLHGADGNPVAHDSVVGPPRHYQWISDPVWLRSHETDSSISTCVTAQGRLFYIVDEAPISLAGDHGLPDKWFLVAKDAFNGVTLWKVPIRRWGWREWKKTWFTNRPGDFPLDIRKRLVAVDDKVYVTLGYRAPVCQLDARTGEILHTYEGTQRASEILVHDQKLVVSKLEDTGLRIMAVHTAGGDQLWETDRTYQGTTTDYLKFNSRYAQLRVPKIDPAANIATDGRFVALIDGSEIAVLDAHTGRQLWQAPFPENEEDKYAGGIRSKGMLWNGTMIVRDGVVIHASPNALAVFAADTGKLLWSQPKKYIGHLWYEWKDVFVIDHLVWTWSAELDEAVIDVAGGTKQRQRWPRSVNGYDIKTGELKKSVPVGDIFRTHHHHRCYRNKATVRYILASRRGTEFVDLVNGQHTVDNWVRGTCHVGMMPANGLQYVPPHPCRCYIEEKLTGMNALASRLAKEPEPTPDAQRLEIGPAFEATKPTLVRQSSALDEQWPAFRHDSRRSGSVNTQVPDDAKRLWSTALGGNVSAPTIAGGRLFVSLVDAHHVVCIDTGDGERLWEYAAGARIDSPPTCYGDRIFFGSNDGCVYCLRAADGELVWRFEAAPERRMIGAYGQLESAWPVHGSVLVQEGKVYFAAGRSSQLDGGIRMVCLDALTGALLHQTRLEGPKYTVDNVQENYNLPMGALTDVLIGDGDNIYMRAEAFDSALNRIPGKPVLEAKGGLLEDSYFKRTPWTTRGGAYGRLIVHDKNSAYYVRMFDTLRGLDPTVFFTPGQKGYLLFANNLGGKQDTWRTRIPVRIRAMVLARDRLLVAGPPDAVDAQDPLGAFEGRRGGRLFVYDASSGAKVAEHVLPSPPVFNGTAAAQEQLFVVDERGNVACFGK